ncbi:MAG: DUF6364 family protein [Chitinophagaceae bacterium]
MDTKLTIKLDKGVIEKAKKYASERRRSLSSIIETYLQAITSEAKPKDANEISPFVKSIYTGKSLPADLDYKKEYSDYLSQKYK